MKEEKEKLSLFEYFKKERADNVGLLVCSILCLLFNITIFGYCLSKVGEIENYYKERTVVFKVLSIEKAKYNFIIHARYDDEIFKFYTSFNPGKPKVWKEKVNNQFLNKCSVSEVTKYRYPIHNWGIVFLVFFFSGFIGLFCSSSAAEDLRKDISNRLTRRIELLPIITLIVMVFGPLCMLLIDVII